MIFLGFVIDSKVEGIRGFMPYEHCTCEIVLRTVEIRDNVRHAIDKVKKDGPNRPAKYASGTTSCGPRPMVRCLA